MKQSKIIQSVSLGLICREEKILCYHVKDKISKDIFFRLIGGHIDFGESADLALEREFKEEVNQDIKIIEKLDVFENIYFYNGNNCHEFVSLFLVDFLDPDMYKINCIKGSEGPDRTYEANWYHVNDFKKGEKTLYPPRILNYI